MARPARAGAVYMVAKTRPTPADPSEERLTRAPGAGAERKPRPAEMAFQAMSRWASTITAGQIKAEPNLPPTFRAGGCARSWLRQAWRPEGGRPPSERGLGARGFNGTPPNWCPER